MIPYEELVAALESYVARGGAPLSPEESAARASSNAPAYVAPSPSGRSPAAPAPAYVPPSPSGRSPAAAPHDVEIGNYDEDHDPDLAPLGQHEEDSTHVGGSPLAAPKHDEHSNEIDIGDVLADDEV